MPTNQEKAVDTALEIFKLRFAQKIPFSTSPADFAELVRQTVDVLDYSGPYQQSLKDLQKDLERTKAELAESNRKAARYGIEIIDRIHKRAAELAKEHKISFGAGLRAARREYALYDMDHVRANMVMAFMAGREARRDPDDSIVLPPDILAGIEVDKLLGLRDNR